MIQILEGFWNDICYKYLGLKQVYIYLDRKIEQYQKSFNYISETYKDFLQGQSVAVQEMRERGREVLILRRKQVEALDSIAQSLQIISTEYKNAKDL